MKHLFFLSQMVEKFPLIDNFFLVSMICASFEMGLSEKCQSVLEPVGKLHSGNWWPRLTLLWIGLDGLELKIRSSFDSIAISLFGNMIDREEKYNRHVGRVHKPFH